MHRDLYIFSKDIKVEIAIKNFPMGYYYVQPSFPICKKQVFPIGCQTPQAPLSISVKGVISL